MSAGRILSSGAGKSPPRGKRVTGFAGPGAPYESSPLATQREAPECFSCYMIQQGHPVTLTLYLSPEGRYHHLQRRRRCRPLSASEHNPSIQPAASAAPPFFYLRQSRHHNLRPEGPSNLRTLRTFGVKPRQPSHRRCVQRRKNQFSQSFARQGSTCTPSR